MGKAKINYGWTAGGSRVVKHKRLIAYGGYGEVHEVELSFTKHTLTMGRCMTLGQKRYNVEPELS